MSNDDASKNQRGAPPLPSEQTGSFSDPVDNDDEEEYDNSWNTVAYWEGVAESVLRVTTAGFCGSLIGLAKERQALPLQDMPSSTNASSLKIIAPSAKSASLPRRPPVPLSPRTAVATSKTTRHLPLVWSVRCMLLATILETSRTISPTKHAWEWMVTEQPGWIPQTITDDALVRPAILALGDYTMGGAVAGLAGSIASRQRSVRFGLGTGLALGLLAGTLQAAMDVASVYVKREQQRAVEITEVGPAPSK